MHSGVFALKLVLLIEADNEKQLEKRMKKHVRDTMVIHIAMIERTFFLPPPVLGLFSYGSS